MRLFIAGFGTETNTFSPFVTGYANFAQTGIFRGGAYNRERPPFFALPNTIWRRRAEERGWEVVDSLATFAMPAGITLRAVYEGFRDEILADLRAAMPVNMVLLNMHGAMVAEGYDDCEGDLLAHVRAIVGPEVPVGAELDLHCHLTTTIATSADATITYKEYPHTDIGERAEELFAIIAAAAEGKLRPHTALYDCGMIGVFHTSREPMRSLVNEIAALEGHDGVLSISIGHGFPWGDVPDMGTRVLVVTDNRPEQGAALAERVGRRVFELREQLQPDYKSIDEALDLALATPAGPVVLADVSDNAGGGAPNDSTFVLRRILERGITSAAIACIWDPIAVALAMEAGEGARFAMRLGGKMGPMSGDPLDLTVTVTKLVPNATQTAFGLLPSPLGDAAALQCDGVDIVVNTKRTQTLGADVFSNLGIEPTDRKILVVKSMQHFYAGFAPIAAQVIYVAAPGALVPDLASIPFRRVNPRLWPLSV
jgi:microcystin degradation protein MlrC